MIIAAPTTPQACCRTISRNSSVQICCICCILSCVEIKDSYQTRGGNFITFQPIINISRTVPRVCTLWHIQINIFFSAGTSYGQPLPVSLLTVPVSLNFFNSLLLSLLAILFVSKFIY